ncbi:MAG: peptidase S8 [Phycisphaeraceae bacterium]|nr:hypothetical protein [Phycisphaerales bacterium]MCB9859404.1 peptidase S8 [Phycisphaeraceae bacterium]
MKKYSTVVRAVALAMPLMLAGAAGAAVSVDETSPVVSSNGMNGLAFPGGDVFYTTSNTISNAKSTVIPGSTTTVITWEEGATSYYAVSFDGSTLAGRVRDTGNQVRLRYASFDPVNGQAPAVNPALRADANNTVYLVQLNSVSTDAARDAITAAGGEVVRFLADNTHIVRADANSIAAINNMPMVRWTGAFHPAYRLDDAASAFAMSTEESTAQRWTIQVYQPFGAEQEVVAEAIRNAGGFVHYTTSDETYLFDATLTPSQLAMVAHMNEVAFVDAWGGPGEWDMDIGRQVLGSAYVQSGVLDFEGSGLNGEIFDTETPDTNPEWNAATGGNGVIHHGPNGNSGTHGSSCFGICFARGVSPQYKGHMPEGQGIFFHYAKSTSFGGTYGTRLQIAQESIDPAGPYRSVFQTSSVGNNRTASYTNLSAEMDNVLFLTNYLHCQSQSNAGNTQSRPEAWAKNILSGGAVQHNNSANPATYGISGASTGPATDGRVKPTLAGFYDSIATTSSTGYTSGFGGTSGGTPMVCGTVGIFFEMWHRQVWPAANPNPGATIFDDAPGITTAKVAMIATARRLSQLERRRQGWGLPNLQKLYDLKDKSAFLANEDAALGNLETHSYCFEVGAGEPELLVSMSYIDPQGTVGAAVHRINDLSLRVTAPNGTVYWGNNGITVTTAQYNTSGGSSNTVDTEENVFVQNPAAGQWTIEVIGDEVVADTHPAAGTNARYSLFAAGGTECGGCYADCDGSGSLNVFDYICFGNEYAAGNSYADCDGSGSLNVFDYICFGNEYAAGCP